MRNRSAFLSLLFFGSLVSAQAETPADAALRAEQEAQAAATAAAEAKQEFLAAKAAAEVAKATRQRGFLAIVEQGRIDYGAAQNDFQRGAARADRSEQICLQYAGKPVEEWRGRLTTLRSTSSGEGVISIAIGPKTSVSTSYGGLFDLDNSVIRHGTRLYDVLRLLKEGDEVAFSGQFVDGGPDCFRETSLSTFGAMTEPDFLFVFSDLSPAPRR